MSEQPKAVEKRLPTLGLCAIVDGRLMGDIGEVYEAVSYFVGRPAFTHELPKYSRLASGRIAEAFPEMSGREQDSWEQVRDDVLAKYSTEVAVPPDWAGCVADGKSAIENVSDAMLAARAKAPVMTDSHMDAPERIWAWYWNGKTYSGQWHVAPTSILDANLYILATSTVLAADPAVKALIAEAEARVKRIAAGLFPGGYDANFAKIEAAIRKGETP